MQPVTRQDYLVSQALGLIEAPADYIRASRSEMLPPLFTDTRGVPKFERGLMDILGYDRSIPNARSHVSGAPVMLHADGSLKNDLIQSSGRYSMQGVFP